jgi:hypothetical protein
MWYAMTTQCERRWAIARILLGFLQMAGAAFSLALLVEAGVDKLSLISIAVTGLLTTISVLLFGSRRQRSSENKFEGRK